MFLDLTPLGMESKCIEDSSITASSIYNQYTHPYYGRVNSNNVWCPRENVGTPYLQVKLPNTISLCGIGTQGGAEKDGNLMYGKNYSVSVSSDGQPTNWSSIKHDGATRVRPESNVAF